MRSLTWIGSSCVAMLMCAALAPDASARNNGIFGRSGIYKSDCTFCHLKAGTAFPVLDVSPVMTAYPPISEGYVPLADYVVTVTVTGGPAVEFGFNFAASAGTGAVTDPIRTQKYPTLPEFTHTMAGTTSPTFQFIWTAPESGSVELFLAVNSANNDDTRFNDAIGTLVTSASPAPAHVMSRIGSATDGSGLPASPFRVNGTPGDARRFVFTDVLSRLSFQIDSGYTGAPTAIRYALYAVRRENRANEVTPLPDGSGTFCFAIPPVGGAPDVLLETFGDPITFGIPRFETAPLGPAEVLSVPRSPKSLKGRRVTFQPLLESETAPSGLVVGNAIVVEFAP